MAAQTFRTDKLIKELERVFERRLDAFEDMRVSIEKSGINENSEFLLGQALGLRRAIYMILVQFDLSDIDLYRQNDARFELDYLQKCNEPKSEASES